ncbi:MAG: hypothetical protein AMXMBFR34_37320 [Myxococcaceae bacterium]
MSTSLRVTFLTLIALMIVGLVSLKAHNRALEAQTQGVAK